MSAKVLSEKGFIPIPLLVLAIIFSITAGSVGYMVLTQINKAELPVELETSNEVIPLSVLEASQSAQASFSAALPSSLPHPTEKPKTAFEIIMERINIFGSDKKSEPTPQPVMKPATKSITPPPTSEIKITPPPPPTTKITPPPPSSKESVSPPPPSSKSVTPPPPPPSSITPPPPSSVTPPPPSSVTPPPPSSETPPPPLSSETTPSPSPTSETPPPPSNQ